MTVKSTIVLQSHRSPLPHPWLKRCMDSVKDWCQQNQYQYLFMGDEFFTPVASALLTKTKQQTVIATDLARLLQCQALLAEGYRTVIWCDADFLIFNPTQFLLPDTPYALGREVWIQHQENKWRSYKKVHNAFLMFRAGNTFLDFYCETAQRLLRLNTGRMPPQFIGPKLLTAIHNIAICPVLETAGMLSPAVILDLLNGGGTAVDMFIQNSPALPSAVNLCSSSIDDDSLTNMQMERLIERLLQYGFDNIAFPSTISPTDQNSL